MYFCTIGFALDEDTYFEALGFNYFVGPNPTPEDEDITGDNEFAIFSQMIAQMGGVMNAETLRANAESEREEAEEIRAQRSASLIAAIVDMLGRIDDASETAMSMMTDIQEAIAQGASIDITDIQALATKTYVENRCDNMDFNEGGTLTIYHPLRSEFEGLNEGEMAYATDEKKLYIGDHGGGMTCLNEPWFTVQAEEPEDTSKLWIDNSGTVPVIKYHDGNEWVSCNTAVFA
jgi:hypothetical protein